MHGRLRASLTVRVAAWARRRQGVDAVPLVLQARRLYILPTRTGIAGAVLLFVMLIAGLNYSNSLALLLTFVVAGIVLVGMHECQGTLRGLELLRAHVPDCHAEAMQHVALHFKNAAAGARRALTLSVAADPDQPANPATSFDIAANACTTVRALFRATRPGRHSLNRIKLATTAPFGLFRCWTWLHLPTEVANIPESVGTVPPPPEEAEWAGLRGYQLGDNTGRIAWKTYARGAPLMVAHYETMSAALQPHSSSPKERVMRSRAAVHAAPPVLGATASALLVAALFPTVAVNVHHLAWWCVPLLALACLLHVQSLQQRRAPPPSWVRVALAALITLGVLLSFSTLNGLSAGATLLTAMAAAKLFEARTRRDGFVLCGATLFLLLAACLDRQQLWRLPIYALCLGLVCASLRALAGGAVPTPRTLLRESARQIMLAIPLGLVLFLFFPRLAGSFWALPADATAVTGLSDEMTPGNIALLVESDEPALRVRFAGAPPPEAELYWRGPVLHDFDGTTWRRHHLVPSPTNPPSSARTPISPEATTSPGLNRPSPGMDYKGPVYHYSLTIEPNSHGTVPALETIRPPVLAELTLTQDRQLVSRRPLTQSQHFELVSYPHAVSTEALTLTERGIDLALPATANPKTRELALHLRAQATGDTAFIVSVLDYLRRGGYEYTLSPQRLGPNAVDDLLFMTRQGFCGHYASAFVDLVRAGGVPARIVTGYQGGEWNPIGRFLKVRQSDAHAWAEVWLAERGWVRTDPTTVVAPERLARERMGWTENFGARGTHMLGNIRWWSAARHSWDAVNAWWQDDVVGFDFSKQLRLAAWLGFGDRDWRTLAIALGVGIGIWLAFVAGSLHVLSRAARPDPLARAWRRIDRLLHRQGLSRAAHEGVLNYCERLAKSRPATAAELRPLAKHYAQVRFGPPATRAETQAFLRAARQFRLRN